MINKALGVLLISTWIGQHKLKIRKLFGFLARILEIIVMNPHAIFAFKLFSFSIEVDSLTTYYIKLGKFAWYLCKPSTDVMGRSFKEQLKPDVLDSTGRYIQS